MKKILFSLLLCIMLVACNAKGNRKMATQQSQDIPTVPRQSPGMMYEGGKTGEGVATDQSETQNSFQVNVYLENSGSMNGYVDAGRTDFQQNVFNYLDDVEQWLGSQLNLFYINSELIPKGNYLDDYINKLTPQDFKNSGGSKSTTDIADLFRLVLEQGNDSVVSILVSDFIFSPGTKNNPEQYLGDQQVKIKRAFENYLNKHSDIAVMVYQLYSNFKGTYYDYLNTPHKNYEGQRPYYIWVIGHPLKIAEMKVAIPESKFLHKVENFWSITSFSPIIENYAILPNPRKGDFTKQNKSEMKRMRKDAQGEFLFTVGADLGVLDLLLGNDYLLDTDHYARIINKQTADDWYITVAPNTIPKSPATHNISLFTKGTLPQGDFELAICRKKPKWADEYSDKDDRVLNDSNQKKTYGLHFIFDGIVQAYSAKRGDYYSSMNFKMN